ncbi:hypothetical protein G6321_00039525 [Bradyrhizobium barranii subsp. barranii]|uniref:Uncharacterized protein n=1 Tax=Bradyrhizobium barranii subsp. barranii TaxID=2823807 RepID=A0A7Z0QGG8_9BRAD|nr:hypothetical protein [Bradyrhizobium barranii]UEM17962.1 hypothetical protein J4G43_053105 [Bradyrhizobium barranii subsp. barranii]UGX91782.1 hypothetical protein G6321_00039525 [Bradyrhizobium barranii subsp. barranii]
MWRYASLPDLVAIMKAATVSAAVFIAAHFFFVRLEAIPRSSIIIAWAFLVVFLAATRAAYRLYRNQRDVHRFTDASGRPAKRVLSERGDLAEKYSPLRSIIERAIELKYVDSAKRPDWRLSASPALIYSGV